MAPQLAGISAGSPDMSSQQVSTMRKLPNLRSDWQVGLGKVDRLHFNEPLGSVPNQSGAANRRRIRLTRILPPRGVKQQAQWPPVYRNKANLFSWGSASMPRCLWASASRFPGHCHGWRGRQKTDYLFNFLIQRDLFKKKKKTTQTIAIRGDYPSD